MRRDIEKELILWKTQKERYPLIIRGARQVGKSYLVVITGKEPPMFISSRYEQQKTPNRKR